MSRGLFLLRRVHPREVKTKFSKSITTYFFPVGQEVGEIVRDWVRYLKDEKPWGNDDPLFPATRVAVGPSRQFEPCGLDRKHWSTATPIRKIFREAFERAGLSYYNPHSLRKTLGRMGEQLCKSPEAFKAWSQNLGHEHVLTTLTSYGTVRTERQGEIIRELAKGPEHSKPETSTLVKDLVEGLRKSGVVIRAQGK